MHSGDQQNGRGDGIGHQPPRTIAICSWQRGFCHGTFNAALVHLASHAFPGHRIRFHAEKSHAPYLNEALSVGCSGVSSIGLEIIRNDLGVPRTATPEEIKSSFRKLARKHHPDVAKDKTSAEAKFKEVSEAYQILSGADKRAQYDKFGRVFEGGGAGQEGFLRTSLPMVL